MKTEPKLICLHTDENGQLWSSFGHLPPEPTGKSSFEFCVEPESVDAFWDKADSLRVVGSRANASVLVGLCRLKYKHPELLFWPNAYIGSPLMLKKTGANPSAVIGGLQQVPSGCSNFHKFRETECATYSLIVEWFSDRFRLTDNVWKMIKLHPAYAALSFIPNIDWENACRWLIAVIDPRWFRHPSRPHRMTKLYNYMGLNYKTISRVILLGGDNDKRRGSYDFRALMTVNTWYTKKLSEVNVNSSKNFLYKIIEAENDPIMGVFKAAKKFSQFVSLFWQLTLTHNSEIYFDSELFFKNSTVAEAFARHCQKLNE